MKTILPFCCAALLLTPLVSAQTYFFNTESLQIGDSNGVEASSSINGITPIATKVDGVAEWRFQGDVIFEPDDFVSIIGSAPIRIVVAGNFHLPQGALISASASGQRGSSGGGNGGPRIPTNVGSEGGEGGVGGRLGKGSTNGDGGDGDNGIFPLEKGSDGTPGTANRGSDGFGNPDSGGSLSGVSLGSSGTGGARMVVVASGGAGGTGDAGDQDDRDGENGRNGMRGGNATSGGNGGGGSGGLYPDNPSGMLRGGGGGSSGSSGGSGGSGSGGNGGGGGGGGGFDAGLFSSASGGNGGFGGSGGRGGAGGNGGAGGAGGAGGGAIEIAVEGFAILAGRIEAHGGDGFSGARGQNVADNQLIAGRTGASGTPGSPGQDIVTLSGGDGGAGGMGGTGGTGGAGGSGGGGGGGAGGTIIIRAGAITAIPGVSATVSGGSGAEGAGDGQGGKVITEQFGIEPAPNRAPSLESFAFNTSDDTFDMTFATFQGLPLHLEQVLQPDSRFLDRTAVAFEEFTRYRIHGSSQSGFYRGVVPTGNISVLPEQKIIFSANAETPNQGGSTLTGDFERGIPTSGPFRAVSGTSCYATNLTGNYSSAGVREETVVSKLFFSDTINVRGLANPVLTYWEWFDIEDQSDQASVTLSGFSGNSIATIVAPFPAANSPVGSSSTPDQFERQWVRRIIPLGFLDERDREFSISFNFSANQSVTEAGWYIDDIQVIDYTP